jgi:S1-C subfamily serine protease
VQRYVIFKGAGRFSKVINAEIIAFEPTKDIAILKIKDNLPAVKLASNSLYPDGTSIAFTGFPIGAIIGLYPATHRGYISATTPDFTPLPDTKSLSTNILKRIDTSFMVYQLDATAYPGNSGSPVYEPETGRVLGIINKVFVKASKEAALSEPSGITYAIPIKYLDDLAKAKNITLNRH